MALRTLLDDTFATRLIVVAAGLMLAVGFVAGCDEDSTGPEDPPPPSPPTVSGVDATVVAPGDTLRITGSDFLDGDPAGNTVSFNNPFGRAKAFAATTTELSVVVPQDAASGPLAVTVAGQSEAGVGPDVEVTRGVGDVWVFGGLAPDHAVSIAHALPTSEFLMIPHATNPSVPFTQEHNYTMTPVGAAVVPVAPQQAAPAKAGVGTMTVRERFKHHLHQESVRVLQRAGHPDPKDIAPAAPAATRQFRQFNVLKTTSGSLVDPANYAQVTAELRYDGSKCLIYTDVDSLAAGQNLTWADIKNLGETFDNQIEPTNRAAFGGTSDIDNNGGRVIIVISGVINQLTPPGSSGFIGGFFLSVDLRTPPSVPTGTTNQAEIFYLLAADPMAVWGNTFSVPFTAQENVKTIAHEHEHLISASQRIFFQQASLQILWLEEGMAHIAEDLNSINSSNILRGNLYLDDPGAISLEHNTAPLEQRGGIYLFLRLLGDRYGNDIFKDIVQSSCVGRPCVEGITGDGFYRTVSEFLAALYLSGKGITSDPRYNYTSIDLTDFDPVGVSSRTILDGDIVGATRRTAGDYYLFTNATSAATRWTISAGDGARLRTVIVQTQ